MPQRARFMTMTDVKRLTKGLVQNTHLARCEKAFIQQAGSAIDVECPDCGSHAQSECTKGN